MNARFPALAGAVALALGACTQDGDGQPSESAPTREALGSTNVAIVNGEPLPESVFRLYSMMSLQRNLEQLDEEEYDRLLDDLIRFKLLMQAAEERGLLDERRIAAELELQRMQLLGRRMAVRYLEENPPTEAEMRDRYEQNLESYLATEYKARHILLESEEEALEVIALLDDGRDFATLAEERSTGPTASDGGDLGYFSPDSMVEPFAEAVRSMEMGSYSTEPVQTQFGWHVILLEDIREQQPPGLDAVREEIRREVEAEKLEEYVESLRTQVTITHVPLE